MRAIRAAVTVSGTAAAAPPSAAHSSSSRKNGLPPARSTMRATTSPEVAAASTAWTSRVLSARLSGGKARRETKERSAMGMAWPERAESTINSRDAAR